MIHMKRIIVPIDFSDYSKKALRYAVEFARQFSAEIILVYVVEPVIYPADFSFGQVAIPSMENELRERGEEQLKKLLEIEASEHIPSRAVVRSGKPFVENSSSPDRGTSSPSTAPLLLAGFFIEAKLQGVGFRLRRRDTRDDDLHRLLVRGGQRGEGREHRAVQQQGRSAARFPGEGFPRR